MPQRRITRFRPLRSRPRDGRGLRRLQLRGGAALLILGSVVIAVLLFLAPRIWVSFQIEQVNQQLNGTFFPTLDKIERHWLALPHLNEVASGQEPSVKAFLAAQPMVVALQDRWDRRTLWLRQGEGLVPASENSPEIQWLRQWITQAEAAQRFQWVPPDELKPDPEKQPGIVLMGDRWIAVKRWILGSPEVEQALRLVLGPQPVLRAGMHRREGPPVKNRQPWGAEPNLQVDPARLNEPVFGIPTQASTFEGWDLWGVPFKAQYLQFRSQIIRQERLAQGIALLIATSLSLGLWLRHRGRLRAVLDADRLASLTHSLKTPLAILKFRCDSLRLGRLTQDQADLELIKIGDEVDRLTLIIENGLAAIQGVGETGPLSTVTPVWLAEVAEDLAPAFETEGRTLSMVLSSEEGLAVRPSLRAALLTLLENALFHGQGAVTLKSQRVRRRLHLEVRDEGPGLEAHQLEALGKPFMRLRSEGKEGFQRDGQGLGLSLLFQMAEKEGWGLTMSSSPGQGLTSTLQIPLA